MDELASYTDHQFEAKLQIEIEQLTKNKQAQESPKAYLLGGQPGAGKSGLHQLIKAEDPNAITIDNDTFKWLHPKYKQLEQKYGKDVVKYVTPFSNQMTESLIDYLSDKKFDLIIEGTLRTVEVPMATVTKLQNRGYEASLYVMAVPRIESYLGTLARYEDQFSLSPRTARATTKEAHDVVVRQLPDNLDFLYKQRLFKEIRLYDRKGNKLYSSLENLNESPKKIITEILNRKLDNNTLLNSIDSVINKMEINHHTTHTAVPRFSRKTTELKKEISGRVQEQLKEFAEKNPEVKPKEDPENKTIDLVIRLIVFSLLGLCALT